jgi:hypothetical protein
MEIFLFIVGLVGGFALGRYRLNPRRTLRRITNGAYVFRPLLMGAALGLVLVFLYSLVT